MITEGGMYQISGDEIYHQPTNQWRRAPTATMTVEGTGYCLPHGLEAYKRTKQYVINE